MSWSPETIKSLSIIKQEGRAAVCKFVSESEEKGGDCGDTHLTRRENVFFFIKFFLLVWRQIVFNLEI